MYLSKEPFNGILGIGDIIAAPYNGFRFMVTIHDDMDHEGPDKRNDGFWPSQDPDAAGYVGEVSDEEFAKHCDLAQEVLDAFHNGQWCYCGVEVNVFFDNVKLTTDYQHALWGVELGYPLSDKDREKGIGPNDYIYEVAEEMAGSALASARHRIKTLHEKWIQEDLAGALLSYHPPET